MRVAYRTLVQPSQCWYSSISQSRTFSRGGTQRLAFECVWPSKSPRHNLQGYGCKKVHLVLCLRNVYSRHPGRVIKFISKRRYPLRLLHRGVLAFDSSRTRGCRAENGCDGILDHSNSCTVCRRLRIDMASPSPCLLCQDKVLKSQGQRLRRCRRRFPSASDLNAHAVHC